MFLDEMTQPTLPASQPQCQRHAHDISMNATPCGHPTTRHAFTATFLSILSASSHMRSGHFFQFHTCTSCSPDGVTWHAEDGTAWDVGKLAEARVPLTRQRLLRIAC